MPHPPRRRRRRRTPNYVTALVVGVLAAGGCSREPEPREPKPLPPRATVASAKPGPPPGTKRAAPTSRPPAAKRGPARTPIVVAPRPSHSAPRPAPRPPVARVPPVPKPADGRFHVRFFAAGHGDGVLLTTPGGKRLLIDAGRGHKIHLGDNLSVRRLVPYFRQRGIPRIDAFMISHPHWDHYGDPVSLFRAVPFRTVYVNVDSEFHLGPGLKQALPGARLQRVKRGDVIQLGKVKLEVLWPPAKQPPPWEVYGVVRTNNRSIVVRATYGKIKFLFTGDLMYGGEYKMLKVARPGRVDVLKLGHHGLGSTTWGWLKDVRPKYAVASCGDKWRQRYDYLSKKLLRRLRLNRVRLYRTDRQGDILFTTDGQTLDVKTFPKLIHVPDWAKPRKRRR